MQLLDRYMYEYCQRDETVYFEKHLTGFWCCTDDVEELERLHSEMLDIIESLHHCSDYWSEYYVPIGIVQRMEKVIAQAKGDNHDQS